MVIFITAINAQNSPVYLDFEGTLPATGGAGSASLATGITHVDATAPGTGGATVSVVSRRLHTVNTVITEIQVDNAIEVDPNDAGNNLLKMDYQGHVVIDQSALGTGSWTVSGTINGNTFGANPQFMGFMSVAGLLSTTNAPTNRQLIYRFANGQMSSLMNIPSSTGFDMLGTVLRHFALTYDASDGRFRMYRDGVLAGTSGVTTSLNNVRVYLGYRGGAQDATTGALTGPALSGTLSKDVQMRLDDLSVFPRAISASEATALFNDPSSATSIANVSWDGSESSDWAHGDNWSTGNVPTATSVVTIPSGMPNNPVVGASTAALAYEVSVSDNAALIVETGGSLTVTEDVTYNRNLATDNWYLVSSPVSGESYDDDYVAANNIDTDGSVATNVAIGTYNASGDSWTYMQDGDDLPFTSGVGYTVKKSVGNGNSNISFAGSLTTGDVNGVSISDADNGFNVLGNPYLANLDSGAFLTDNSNLDTQIWLFNQATGNYESKISGLNYVLAPGQGFFVKANSGSTVNFLESNIVTTAGTFQKSALKQIKLLMNTDNVERYADIYFTDSATSSYDAGWEGERFKGASASTLDIYTSLVANDEGKKYQVQTLSSTDVSSAVVAIGIIAQANEVVKISAETQNLPQETFVYLEDREKGTFTLLNDNGSISFETDKEINGIGRFYLHTSQSALSVSDVMFLESVSVFKINNNTLRVSGLTQGKASIKLFNVLGKQMMDASFISEGVNDDISLPQLAKGIYIVQLETKEGKLNKKIILE